MIKCSHPVGYIINMLTDCTTISFYHKSVIDIIKVECLSFTWYFFSPTVKLWFQTLIIREYFFEITEIMKKWYPLQLIKEKGVGALNP